MTSRPGIPFAATGQLEARLGVKAGGKSWGHDDFDAGDTLFAATGELEARLGAKAGGHDDFEAGHRFCISFLLG